MPGSLTHSAVATPPCTGGDEPALISALTNKHIAGAAIDVFDVEPLPPNHPFRTLDNVLATPHIGYVSQGLYKTFYEDTVSNTRKWLDTH